MLAGGVAGSWRPVVKTVGLHCEELCRATDVVKVEVEVEVEV